jgi:outer membrane protein TolC
VRRAALTLVALAWLAASARPAAAAEPLPEASERLTLAQAVARAQARNPTVAVARAEIARADALIKEARAAWYPTLVGNGLYTRIDHERALNGRVITSANAFSGNLTLTVPLLAPVGWAATWAAERAGRVAEANAAETSTEVATAAARAYLAVVAQHRLIAASETARANAKAHYDYAHTRLLGGVGHSIDEVRAAQDLATVDVQVESAYLGLARAREALGVLLATNGPVDSLEDAPLGPPPALESALDDARTRRPDVRALERRLASSEKAIKETWTYYAPILTAVGQPFVQAGSALSPQWGWQAQLVLTLPLYDGGARTGITREREALAAEARASLEATLRQAQSDVRLGFESMLRADEALRAAREAARLAKRASELATLAYQAGATTNIEVIDAARRERDADVAAAQAEDVARQARLDLLVASGHFP